MAEEMDIGKIIEGIKNGSFIAVSPKSLQRIQTENKRLKEGYGKILACHFDDKCETDHGLAERYYFVPRSIIDQALQEKPK